MGYRASFTLQNRPRNPAAGDPPMTPAADPQIIPRPPVSRVNYICRSCCLIEKCYRNFST